jgi:hypothetical protein
MRCWLNKLSEARKSTFNKRLWLTPESMVSMAEAMC